MSPRDRAPWSALYRAIELARAHPQVVRAGPFYVGSRAAVQATFRVNLPSESKQRGASLLGVRLEEPVRFEFPRDYPMQAPELSLRANFSRNHPHIQPWLTDGRPVPCIYEGDIRELLHQEGFAGLLNQTALWLDRAAAGDLIDPEQGWEPVRRDSYGDHLVGDADFLRSLVSKRRGYRFCGLTYVRLRGSHVYGRISDAQVDVGHSAAWNLFSGNDDGLRDSLALVVWPPNSTSRPETICNNYRPETVDSLVDLMRRAAEYGCAQGLESGLTQLRLYLSRHPRTRSFTLAVVLLTRRPFRLIGSQSPFELCPYVIDVVAPDHFAAGDATPVRPADVVDLNVADAVLGCDEGLLEFIDPGDLPPGADGSSVEEDFVSGTLTDCGMGTIFFSSIYAFHPQHFADARPATIEDFFDLERFPGRRGMRRVPSDNLEFALLADGVPLEEVYAALDTPQG